MINIDTLEKNKYIFNPDKNLSSSGFGIWDLTKASVTAKDVVPRIQNVFFASDSEEMRPDLISSRIFGTTTYIGSILKTNMISNPFSIEKGDQIIIFKTETMDSMFENKKFQDSVSSENPNSVSAEALKKSQENKRFLVSNSRAEYLNRIAKSPAQPLPPNVMQEGDVQTLRTSDFIVFGPSVSTGGPTISE